MESIDLIHSHPLAWEPKGDLSPCTPGLLSSEAKSSAPAFTLELDLVLNRFSYLSNKVQKCL